MSRWSIHDEDVDPRYVRDAPFAAVQCAVRHGKRIVTEVDSHHIGPEVAQ